MLKNIAIFASGNGSNALNIINLFKNQNNIQVKLLVCNKKDAPVIQLAKNHGVEVFLLDNKAYFSSGTFIELLTHKKIDLIVLAGFLWLLPESLIAAFPKKIINVHPSLLPKYGGKGMYGIRVHEAVIKNKEEESGITIHYVDCEFDTGEIIFQVRCPVLTDDSPQTLAKRVHELEYKYYPAVIEKVIKDIL